MKKHILLLLLCLPLAIQAQVDSKYLEGAVPVVDGKVTFTTDIKAKGLSQEQIFKIVLNWANNRFQPAENMNARVLYNKPEEGNIVAGGEEYIVFTSNALALDRTRIYYHLIANCTEGYCNLTMTRIHYWYDENRDGGYKYKAEEWITDKEALNKSKTKLALVSGKFRKKTIDYKNELFAEVQKALNDQVIASINEETLSVTQEVAVTPVQPTVQVAVKEEKQPQKVTETTPLQPAKEIMPLEEQEKLIKNANRMTITANDEQFEIGKESWGGFGEMFGKKVAFCFIESSKKMGNMLMTQAQEYTISFFTLDSSQPCVVIKCKKLIEQEIKGKAAKNMNPNCAEGKSYNMYVGGILE